MPVRGEGRNAKTATKSGEILAQFAGVSRDTIKEWRKKPGFPVNENGETELWALAVWRLRCDGVIPPADGEKFSRQELADLRKSEADATIKETKARKDLAQLIDKAAVIACITTLFHAIRSRVEAIPGEIASSLPPQFRTDVSRDVAFKISLALREMTTWSGPDGIKPLPPPESKLPQKTSGKPRSTPAKSKPAAKRSRHGKSR